MLAKANVLEATGQDRFCSVLSMYHRFFLTTTVLPTMTAGECVCFPNDRHYRETVCACVVSRRAMTEDHIRMLVQEKAASFKVPQQVLFFDEFPRSQLGKIQFSALKAAALARLGVKMKP